MYPKYTIYGVVVHTKCMCCSHYGEVHLPQLLTWFGLMEVGLWWGGEREREGRKRSGRNGRGGGGRCAVVEGCGLGLEDIEEASERAKRAESGDSSSSTAKMSPCKTP
jgi:hypothetical protein